MEGPPAYEWTTYLWIFGVFFAFCFIYAHSSTPKRNPHRIRSEDGAWITVYLTDREWESYQLGRVVDYEFESRY